MRAKALVPILLILMASFIAIAPNISAVHAAVAIVHKQIHTDNGIICNACVDTLSSSDTSGALDVVVVNIGDDTNQNCPLSGITGATVSDTDGAYVLIGHSDCWGFGQGAHNHQASEVFVYDRVASATHGSNTITVTYIGLTNVLVSSVQYFDVSGATTDTTTAKNAAECVTQPCIEGVPSVTFSAPAFLVAGIMLVAAATPATPGTGFTMYGTGCQVTGCSMYGNDTIVTSPTTFPWTNTQSASDYTMFAVAFAPLPPVIVVTPCNFFQLQCWLYPLFFVGVFMVFVMGMAVAGRVPSKSQTFLILATLTIAFTLEVMMGMVNIMFPLILTILGVVYALRQR